MNPRSELFETFAIQGMSMRDYFAAKVMQGMLTNQPLRVDVMLNGDLLAQSSYQIAGAMMKARNNDS